VRLAHPSTAAANAKLSSKFSVRAGAPLDHHEQGSARPFSQSRWTPSARQWFKTQTRCSCLRIKNEQKPARARANARATYSTARSNSSAPHPAEDPFSNANPHAFSATYAEVTARLRFCVLARTAWARYPPELAAFRLARGSRSHVDCTVCLIRFDWRG